MKCIYEASSGLEAHMILNLLQQEEIDCRIDGEYLQGGMGELQAMSMVRVLVDEADFDRARSIINEWESREVVRNETPAPISKSGGIATGLVFGLVIGAATTYWAFNTPVNIDGIDYNDDGQLDEKWIYRDYRLSKTEMDYNLDGTVDQINSYNRKGINYKSVSDINFDGVFDTTTTYNQGKFILEETDTDNDGIIDLRTQTVDDTNFKSEIIDPASNRVRKISVYRLNKLVSAEFDSNGDGLFDKSYKYDFYEEIK